MSIVASAGTGLYSVAGSTESHAFIMQRHYVSGGRGAIYCHGFSGRYNDVFVPGSTVISRYASIVGPILTSDQGFDSFGNDTGISRFGDARTFFITKFGVNSKVNVFAGSMGASVALNFAKANPTLINAMALVIPLTNFADIHDNNRLGFGPVMEAAYGGLAAYNAAMPTHDPFLQAANTWAGIPIKVWNSSTDPLVLPSIVAASVAKFKWEQQIYDGGPAGHNAEPIDMMQVAEFFAAHP